MLLALILTVRTAAVKGHPADPTVVIVGHPEPGGNPVPLFDFHLHPADLTGAQTHHTGAANASTIANVDTRSLNINVQQHVLTYKEATTVSFRYLTLVRLAKNKSFSAGLIDVYNIKVMF